MKKSLFMLALAATVFIACDKDEKNDEVVVNDNFSEAILGKWLCVENYGKPMLTNVKYVTDIVSTSKAFMSMAARESGDTVEIWANRLEIGLVVDEKEKKFILINKIDEKTKSEVEMSVTSFSADEMTTFGKTRQIKDSDTLDLYGYVFRFKKINVDYSDAIIGTWEGRCTSSDGSVFDDGENHRWEYRSDGNYYYYYKENGEWKLSEPVYSNYFVQGPMLFTRWQNVGSDEKNNENWEIESIKDNVMKWSALRKKENGSTYTVTFEMRKVQ